MDNANETLFGMENDIALLQFLRSNNSDRFTKLDAFCNLIGRMSGQSKASKGNSQAVVSPLCYGIFTGSISELAQDWHWHRATVRSFLDGLESLGILSRELKGRDYTFKLRTHISLSVPVVTFEVVHEIANFLLQHWNECSLTPEFLAAYFDEYAKIETDTYVYDDHDTDPAKDKAAIVLEAFCHLEFSKVNTIPDDDSVVQMVASTFRGSKQWSWEKWMRALMHLDMGLIGQEYTLDITDKESVKHDAFVSDFSEQDLRLLRELFYQVKKIMQRDTLKNVKEAKDSSSSLSSEETE